ncbi:hypothetical protein [Synechocystis sp. CACIAM 05]|uniref:hypothetical protein n=1 Tax=Synechocystis sp. CACIAM 05 TaxID=1933929 RepID=UPI00138E7247|nr:hypothetical protein [Synechocystis sp. CACIAM 05]QHV01511.1 hypothetical protein BWK47_16155 [Synechocystis sp. CACIAM 05]
MLDADNTNFSLYNALSFLEAIRTKLDQYQYDLEDKKQEMGTMKVQEDLEEIWNEAEAEIDAIKPKGFIPWSKKRDYQTIQNIIDKAVTEIAKLLKHNYELFALDEAIRIVESLKEYVSLRLNQITNLDTFIKRLLQYYRQQENEIKATKVEEIPGEAIFPEEEIDRLVPPNSSRDKLASNTNEVAKELNFSLFELAATNHFAEDSIKISIKNVLERNFVIGDVDQMQSVAKRFMINYSPTQQAIALENVAKKSEPLLDIFKNDPLFLGAVESFTIGFKTSDSIGDDPLRKILTDQLGIPNIAITSIQADNEILFVKEYGGFPLRLINHLRQLKRVYDNQKPFGKLHNHGYVQFDDIIPAEARIIENLEYILYPCLALNILSENSQNSEYYEFSCYDSLRNEYYIAELSKDWRIALEQLVERPDMSEILTQSLRDEENKIISNPSLWQSKYRSHINAFINCVDNLKEGDRNFILKTKVIGQRATVNNSAKEGVIPRYIKGLETKIKASQIALSPSIDINQKNLSISSDPSLD